MSFTLPPLPYAMNALAPYISEETIEYHYGKHHRAYVDNLNKLVVGTPFENQSLEVIIKEAKGPLFNNAAQIWNHTFYWNCLSPNAGGEPHGKTAEKIKEAFGSFEQFKEQFTKLAASLFGSGWAWLIQDPQGKLSLIGTSNGDTPMEKGNTALLTCDVWEHAYYIDYRNVRMNYIEAFWKLVNWEFVGSLIK